MDDYNSIYSGEEIDERLTAVGRKIELPSSAYAGKVPRANGMGGVDWVTIGQPTDAQTAAAVSAWLAAHPEATTTVRDGAVTTAKIADGAVTMAKLAGGVYAGVDLTEKFASEVGSDPWAWIKGRIQTGNYSGIHVGDWIPFTAGGNTYNAQVAGIDTYRNSGSSAIGRHIDFICRELWPEAHPQNMKNYNNGLSTETSPWLACDLYHWLNSLSGSVPNGTGADPATTPVDYTSTGVYDKLPGALKAIIVEKHYYIENRYSASGLLTDSAGNKWANIGKLWLPSEVEVCGSVQAGTPFVSSCGGVQYPLFAHNMNRVRKIGASRSNWWMLSAASGNTTRWGFVHARGYADSINSSVTYVYAPICFRIA